ncbi:DUF1566 domain-containing protein [Microbulbifer litoralis]|uniref:Lcl C-terminal domain-containing protein n=1 Tax=Microbulbifer litoralis TaxID=2933965 RepID=UPI0020282D7C|nr:DUF1566 domain-containing protein [Microbulbifer sp. GX H0434]
MIGTIRNTALLLILMAPISEAQTGQHCKPESIAPTAPSSRFQRGDNGSVVDTRTHLMWRACLEGVTGEACDEGKPLALTWAEALAYVPNANGDGGFAGHSDWRLPNIRELGTLVELQCTGPAINLAVFNNAPAAGVWSSSPSGFHTHYSWYVDFVTGAFTYGERAKPKAIRLVRDLH